MCNEIHKELENAFQEIPDEGEGMKIVVVGKDEKYHPLCNDPVLYHSVNKDGYFEFIGPPNQGFCFFLPDDMLKEFPGWVLRDMDQEIVKILYRDGLGSFIETKDKSWSRGTRFAICRQFKFVEEETNVRIKS